MRHSHLPHLAHLPPLRQLLLAVALTCAALPGAQASEDWLGGFVLVDDAKTGVRTDRLNPGNFFAIAPATANLGLLLEGQQSGIAFRARGQVRKNFGDSQSTAGTGTILELYKTFKPSENTSFSIGKRLFSLDQSFVGQPLGFFQKQTDLTDPTDAAGRAEGLPMLVLSWANEKSSLTGIYSNDIGTLQDGFNRGIKQSMLRFGYEFTNLSVSLIMRHATGESTGLGATFSATLSDDASVYGSFYRAKGTQRPTLASLANLSSTPQFSTSRAEAIGFFRQQNDVAYPRATLGAVYTPKNLPKIQVELIYDRRGLSDSEYERYLALVRLHEAGASQHLPAGLINANLAFDSEILIGRGARRKYASLNVDDTFGDFSVGCGAYIGLADNSGIYYCGLGYTIRPRLTGSFSATTFRGGRDSERGLSPVSDVFTARLKWTF